MVVLNSLKALARRTIAPKSPVAGKHRRFYQAIDLSSGPVDGAWDHRGSENVYLGHVNFSGLSAIDIGPANGFWSFEMERRGAQVTAVELGPNDDWDAVPHEGSVNGRLKREISASVAKVHKQFMECHRDLKSKVKIARSSIYNAPSVVKPADVVLLGNILQHLRDPFLAIERAANLAKDKIIISESIWHDDPALMNSAQLYLIPRVSTPSVQHSWYQVSPVFVMEVLLLLGFKNLKNEIHEQRFNGYEELNASAKSVKHFTVTAER